jgi:hypothetical protein
MEWSTEHYQKGWFTSVGRTGSDRHSQEQTQIIASAIDKPAAKAPTIVKVNAESKFASGRTLSTDMLLAPPQKIKKPLPGRMR